MAISQLLIEFVKEGLQRRLTRDELQQALITAGWNKEQVRGAIASFAEIDFPVPVPRPRAHVSAGEAFMYLVMFATLYLSAYHTGKLVFELIDRAFPDPAVRGNARSTLSAIRWSVSTLIVAFPVFLFAARKINQGIRVDATKRASKARRDLTYITLFVAGAVLVGDVTTLVYNVLGGELATRFFLKVMTVAVIAGTAFWYYLRELRLDEKEL